MEAFLGLITLIILIVLIVFFRRPKKSKIDYYQKPEKFKRKIQTIYFNISGVKFNSIKRGEPRTEILRYLEVLHPVKLKHEPENEYDDLAILVIDSDDNDLGYVPKTEVKRIHRFWNDGNPMEARINKKSISKTKPYCEIEVDVYKWIENEE